MTKEENDMSGQIMNKQASTAYKGAGITLVILCHLANELGHGFRLFTPLGGIGVSIFLFLSAYGLNESWNNNCEAHQFWLRKRFIAVWIPYIVVQLLLYWPFNEFDVCKFFLDLSLIQPLYKYGWYLQYLSLWYFIFYIVRRIEFLDKYKIIIFAVVSFVMFFSLREIKAEQSLSFLMGIIISERKEVQHKLFKPWCCALLLILGISCLAVKQLPLIRLAPQLVMNTVQLGIKLPLGLGLIILLHIIMRKMRLKALYYVGLISYELYLIHGYSLFVVPPTIIGAILFFVITVTTSIAFWLLMKKIQPFLYRCFRLKSTI